ncbi:MPN domain-containing protein [Rubinisphaera brasiliensis]|uniref:JAB domain-containing protein n=1 Tax=Rubinisphaera brasiliensis (strain ATCC 49424 / DSM 5305 / JCM 21570 / IAM 15109 / NBRC 103401 / IFAM 1448) TaxID=756272 RepID=F0SHC9_RUBBR|nr:hypothetical protein [Rubinisphaera brasiliensis]ADY61684.1 hypothetical protein Plabr_4107 [Rubinisphaera brasiliensis DSM 5305]
MKINPIVKRNHRPPRPALRFSPTAWAKLLYLRDYGPTEVGAFGISKPDDLLQIQDLQLIEQTCSWAHVEFSDEAVADFFDTQIDLGRRPEHFGRVWIHTHPGDSPFPSPVDEETFRRVFGKAAWALMFILARGGESYARLRFNSGPGGDVELPVEVDYSSHFDASDQTAWEAEYLSHVSRRPTTAGVASDESGLPVPVDEDEIEHWLTGLEFTTESEGFDD